MQASPGASATETLSGPLVVVGLDHVATIFGGHLYVCPGST
jgi:hypothetical protein